jgi:peptidoglycan hydrolase-like protein with peptidoglycan-binding domain
VTRRDSRADADEQLATSTRTDDDQQQVSTGARGDTVATLHGAVGNQAVKQLREDGEVQPKLMVSRPTDEAEREADRVAQWVTRMAAEPGDAAAPDPGELTAGGNEDSGDRHASPTDGSVTAVGRRLRIDASPQPGGATSDHSPGESIERGLRSAPGGGPLSSATRSYFEPRFGRDFGDVRVHTGRTAAALARALDAKAFTHGTDIYFGETQYQPKSAGGKRLLAHELTHVVQQTGADRERLARRVNPAVVQRATGASDDLQSLRFRGNEKLEEVFDSDTTIGKGERGVHVTIVQQALVDAGFSLPKNGVDGVYDSETADAVEEFQLSEAARRGLGGWVPLATGEVDKQTIEALDQYFQEHEPERDIATDPSRSPTEGTRSLSDAEEKAVTEAITTEQRTAGGSMPTFNRTIPGAAKPYEERIEERLNEKIDDQYTHLVDARPSRDPGNLFSASTINDVAQRAKEVTDDVFGEYYSPPSALEFDTNIFDAYEARDKSIGASKANADWAAQFRVEKILKGDSEIRQIDEEHGAVQSRTREEALLEPIQKRIVRNRRSELLDIHRNWPGYADPDEGHIMIQRYKASSDAENRDKMWRLFATFIHEYLHTLEHPEHEKYRDSLPETEGEFVLQEGMTDYLAKMVWDNLEFDESLRAAVEGPFHDPSDPTGHPIPDPPRYPEAKNAGKAVGIVGIRNAMAAFFTGKTELIGGQRTYTVEKDDTLWGVAGDMYGDPTKWRTIARANGISDAKSLTPGTVLLIPEP